MERLLRERTLRKNRSFQSNDGDSELSRSDSFSNDIDADFALLDEEESQERRSFSDNNCKQRLLVVANRLPVSAVRSGVDSWQLEVSVGGLVSALLGKCFKNFSVLVVNLNIVAFESNLNSVYSFWLQV